METPEEKATFETAFLILKMEDGNWRVTDNVNLEFDAKRAPTRADIRIGCQEIATIVSQQDLAAVLADMLVSLSLQAQEKPAEGNDGADT